MTGPVEITLQGLLRETCEVLADGLTEAATRIRDRPEVAYTADQVADLLTGLAASAMQSAERHFADPDPPHTPTDAAGPTTTD